MIRGLSGLIDLVVVFCAREADELDDIVIEPGASTGRKIRPFSNRSLHSYNRMTMGVMRYRIGSRRIGRRRGSLM